MPLKTASVVRPRAGINSLAELRQDFLGVHFSIWSQPFTACSTLMFVARAAYTQNIGAVNKSANRLVTVLTPTVPFGERLFPFGVGSGVGSEDFSRACTRFNVNASSNRLFSNPCTAHSAQPFLDALMQARFRNSSLLCKDQTSL